MSSSLFRKPARTGFEEGPVPAPHHDRLVDVFGRTTKLFETLQHRFKEFMRHARNLNDPGSPVKGITVSSESDCLLVLSYLDRCFRVSMHLDRKRTQGVLHLDDHSADSSLGPAQTVVLISFDELGDTEFDCGPRGGKLNIAHEGDAVTLVLHMLDLALNYDPWRTTHEDKNASP
jgi:hypothetical protein